MALLYRPAVVSGNVSKLSPMYRLVRITEELPQNTYRLADANTGQKLPYVYHTDRLRNTSLGVQQPSADGQVNTEVQDKTSGPQTTDGSKSDQAQSNAKHTQDRDQETVGQGGWFAISRIIKRRRQTSGRWQYLVEWSDGSPPTWHKAGDISKEALAKFYARLKKRGCG